MIRNSGTEHLSWERYPLYLYAEIFRPDFHITWLFPQGENGSADKAGDEQKPPEGSEEKAPEEKPPEAAAEEAPVGVAVGYCACIYGLIMLLCVLWGEGGGGGGGAGIKECAIFWGVSVVGVSPSYNRVSVCCSWKLVQARNSRYKSIIVSRLLYQPYSRLLHCRALGESLRRRLYAIKALERG